MREPRVDLREGFGSQCVQTPFAFRADRDEPRFTEHLEVLGDAGLAEREALHQLPGGPLTLAQQVEDLPTVRLGHRGVRAHGFILPI